MTRSLLPPTHRTPCPHRRRSLQLLSLGGLGAFLPTGLLGCGGGDSAVATTSTSTPSKGKAKWTYMVYIAGENDLSKFVNRDLTEMMQAQGSPLVKVPVMYERSGKFESGATSAAQVGVVTNGHIQTQNLGENLVFSDKDTLRKFIQWSKTNYPAERYGLVLWSHGSGWRHDAVPNRSALYDNNNGRGYTAMSVRDMAAAVQDAGGVDLVNFDACLMGMYEVAYEFQRVATVLVGSEENIPGYGNPYDLVISRLAKQPDQDAFALGRGIVDDFTQRYASLKQVNTQLSAIDLRHMPTLHEKVQLTASALSRHLNTYRTDIQGIQERTTRYEDPANKDLIGFALGLAQSTRLPTDLKTAAEHLVTASRAAILNNKVWTGIADDTPIDRSEGLAIYLPSMSETSTADRTDYRSTLAVNDRAHLVAGGTPWSAVVDQLTTGSGTAP